MRNSVWFCMLMAVGCDRLDAELPALSLQRAEPATSRPRTPASAQASAPVDVVRSQVDERQEPLRAKYHFSSLPEGTALPRCDTRVGIAKNGEALTTAYVDARRQTRNLISHRLAERLESRSIAQFLNTVDQSESNVEKELPVTDALMRDLTRMKFIGVFYITDYSGPALVLRVGDIKRSWYAGTMAATFAIYDLEQQRPRCGYALRVQNETKDAPIRSRLQSETRSRLERELAAALISAASAEAGKDIPELKLQSDVSEAEPRSLPKTTE